MYYRRLVLLTLLTGSFLQFFDARTMADILASWDVNAVSGYGPSPLAPNVFHPDVVVQGLTRGSGVGTSGTAAARAWGGNGWQQSVVASDAIAAGKFATFGFTSTAPSTVSFQQISKFNYRRSGTGPSSGVLQVQVGGGEFADIATLSFSSSSSSGASLAPIDLSAISALQNVASGVPVVFRIVQLGATSSGGTWYVFDLGNTTVADLEVQGVVGGNVQPGFAIVESSGSTTVSEGSATVDSYTVALKTAPAGPVSIELQTGNQIQISTDNITFGSSATIALGSTTPASVYVRAVDDADVEASPHLASITQTVVSSEDPSQYPVGMTVGAVQVSIQDNDFGPGPLRIHDLQGISHVSPHANTVATRVPGIVTVRRSNGFFFQDPIPDNDVRTSEGMFVFTDTAPTVAVGDSVLVTGTVAEFRPGNDNENLTITELLPSQVVILSGGNGLPAPIVIGNGGRSLPTEVIADDAANGNVESVGTVFDPENDGLDFFESLEGMRVQVNNAIASGTSLRFGELPVLADNGVNATSRSAAGGSLVSGASDFNPERIILDDGLGLQTPAVNVGATFTAPIVGVIDYSFGNYKLQYTTPLSVGSLGREREVTTLVGDADHLTIATFNLENLDPADGAEKFGALATQIVKHLLAPDILNLEEVQDNNGAQNNGVVDASTTYQLLIQAILNVGGPEYSYRQIDPMDGQDGGEPGGNIRVGFLYNAARVTFVDRPGGTSTVANSVVNQGGRPQLAYSPGRIEPLDVAFNNSRKPLVGEFVFNGTTLFVIGNHFNSKGGDQPPFGRFQPPALLSEVQRMQQAELVRAFTASILAMDPKAKVIVLGDLNDFQFSNPVNLLKSTGLVDLIEMLPASERYTYVFDGNSQVLDHVMGVNVTAAVDVVHINAEFVDQVSDHDPVVARLTLDGTDPVASVSCTRTAAGQILTVSATDAVTSVPAIYAVDSVSGFVAGPYKSGDRLFVRVVPGQVPFVKPLVGYAARLQFRGAARIIAVDEAGNQSLPALCE